MKLSDVIGRVKPLLSLQEPPPTPEEPNPPAWLQALFDEHGVHHMLMGRLFNGDPIWGCTGCSCWFSVDDDSYIDRYAFVNDENGWCNVDDCECHALPRRRPEDRLLEEA